MKSVKDMPIVQDGPPPGGFPAVRYARRLPNSGPGGLTLFGIGVAVIAYGFYKVGEGNLKRRAIKEEKLEARKALVPYLQAEEDRRWVKAYSSFVEKEKEIMKSHPDFKAEESVYKTRWLPPARQVGFWGDA